MKKSVAEILALPQWEREVWRDVFSIYGPLDWKREDLLFARVNQFQATGSDPLREFVLFSDPTDDKSAPKKTEADVFRMFGIDPTAACEKK